MFIISKLCYLCVIHLKHVRPIQMTGQFIGVAWVFFLVRQLKNARGFKRIFPEFKWIIYNFNNNRKNTQKTFDMRLVTFFGTSRQLWGELYLL